MRNKIAIIYYKSKAISSGLSCRVDGGFWIKNLLRNRAVCAFAVSKVNSTGIGIVKSSGCFSREISSKKLESIIQFDDVLLMNGSACFKI